VWVYFKKYYSVLICHSAGSLYPAFNGPDHFTKSGDHRFVIGVMRAGDTNWRDSGQRTCDACAAPPLPLLSPPHPHPLLGQIGLSTLSAGQPSFLPAPRSTLESRCGLKIRCSRRSSRGLFTCDAGTYAMTSWACRCLCFCWWTWCSWRWTPTPSSSGIRTPRAAPDQVSEALCHSY